MNQKEHLQEQSKTRSILIKAEIALKEGNLEEALNLISSINVDEISNLNIEELNAIGNLINYIKAIAEERKLELINQLKIIQASKEYL